MQRRVKLGFDQRPEFVRAAGLKHGRIVASLENAERTNYDDATKVRYEIAYKWRPGSMDSVLAGGDPEELDDDAQVATVSPAPLFDNRNWQERILGDQHALAEPAEWPDDLPTDDFDAIKAELDALVAEYIETANTMTQLERQIRSLAVTRARLDPLINLLEDRLAELDIQRRQTERLASVPRVEVPPDGIPKASDEQRQEILDGLNSPENEARSAEIAKGLQRKRGGKKDTTDEGPQ